MDKCKVCNAEMLERDGRYGKFMYCPNSTRDYNHGTKSIVGAVCATEEPSDGFLHINKKSPDTVEISREQFDEYVRLKEMYKREQIEIEERKRYENGREKLIAKMAKERYLDALASGTPILISDW
jgi:ssDNA-binding Zn-finger/Zn-ribbon topoisomerase 1